MKKHIILFAVLMLSLSGAVFGQTFEGQYKAEFIAIGNTPKPEVHFEIHSDNTITGQLRFGEVVTKIKGQVDYDGKMEAKSAAGSRPAYTLKANINRDYKITLTSRSEENSAGIQKSAQFVMQGSYSLIVKPVFIKKDEPLVNGKSSLLIEQSAPMFEKEFSGDQAKVKINKENFSNVYDVEMILDDGKGNRRHFFFNVARISDSSQTIWKIENIRFIGYMERTDNYKNVNYFYSEYDIWLKN